MWSIHSHLLSLTGCIMDSSDPVSWRSLMSCLDKIFKVFSVCLETSRFFLDFYGRFPQPVAMDQAFNQSIIMVIVAWIGLVWSCRPLRPSMSTGGSVRGGQFHQLIFQKMSTLGIRPVFLFSTDSFMIESMQRLSRTVMTFKSSVDLFPYMTYAWTSSSLTESP